MGLTLAPAARPHAGGRVSISLPNNDSRDPWRLSRRNTYHRPALGNAKAIAFRQGRCLRRNPDFSSALCNAWTERDGFCFCQKLVDGRCRVKGFVRTFSVLVTPKTDADTPAVFFGMKFVRSCLSRDAEQTVCRLIHVATRFLLSQLSFGRGTDHQQCIALFNRCFQISVQYTLSG